MSLKVDDLQNHIVALEQKLAAIANENELLARDKERIDQEKALVMRENTDLREQLKLLRSKLFGRTSEKLSAHDDEQHRMFNEIEASLPQNISKSQMEAIAVNGHSRKKGGRAPLPDHLPRTEIIHDITDDEKHCACGADLVRIGEETCEKLSIIPPQIFVERHIRPQYACKRCEGSGDESRPSVRIAPMPEQLLPKSLANAALLAYLLTAKFVDGLPFYRIENILKRMSVELSRETMCTWAMRIAQHRNMRRLMALLRSLLMKGPLIGCDETTLQVLNEPGRANTLKSFMWLLRGGPSGKPVLWFSYLPGRTTKWLQRFLRRFNGYFQSDGYSGYDEIGRRKGIIHLGCWAHARRHFSDLLRVSPESEAAKNGLSLIGRLYEIERIAREKKLSPDQIFFLRQAEAKPVLDEIKSWLDQIAPEAAPRTALGIAVHYALGQWTKLIRYIDDGHVTIDNNLVENGIRPFVLGRKAWLFSGCPRGAHASATLFTLIENAKANGLEPYAYLRFLLENLNGSKTRAELTALLPQFVDPSALKMP